MQDDSYVATFVAECAENLSTVENDLVELERLGSEADDELVNRIFRAAHSIKGGAGFLELESVKELAHKLESVLDLVRSRSLVPDPEITSILLKGFDKLGDLINAAGSGGADDAIDSTEELAALSVLLGSRLSTERKQEAAAMRRFPLPRSSRALEADALALDLARNAGKSIIMLRLDLIHDVQRMGKTPFDILSALESRGDVMDSAIDIESVGTLQDEGVCDILPFCALFASALPVVKIAREVEIPLSGITILEEPLAASAATAPAAMPKTEPMAEAANARGKPADVAPQAKGERAEDSVRIPVLVLDRLMETASELVLARNELLESLRSGGASMADSARRIDQVTRAIQEAVTLTRMQPIGNLFGRYPRLVRDLALETGKSFKLEIEGRDVEVDKTILETLSDPLLHLIRNACDHGIEPPAARKAAGKSETGRISIRARHEAGTIVVEVEDDGAGIDAEAVASKAVALGLASQERVTRMSEGEKQALIFLPGLSTSAKVTDISGRGVGMDVVKTNVDKLGGQVDIFSRLGSGSRIRLRLPLTLAIIPSLLISVNKVRYAIPEANVEELIKVRPGDARTRIEKAAGGEVLVLRGEFIPLLRLDAILGGSRVARPEEAAREGPSGAMGGKDASVIVVNSQALRYALVVDELHDTAEIVVKPLGRHFAKLREYSGATILGNGLTALILDTTGLAAKAALGAQGGTQDSVSRESGRSESEERVSSLGLLLFGNGPEQRCAVPLESVDRVVHLPRERIDHVGSARVFSYQGEAIPLFALSDALEAADPLEGGGDLVCILFRTGKRRFGLIATTPVDSVEDIGIDASSFSGRGLRGSAVIGGRATLVVDIGDFAAMLKPEWFGEKLGPESAPAAVPTDLAPASEDGATAKRLILVADDSAFFRERICSILSEEGYGVLPARDGEDAFALFKANSSSVRACVFDLEMPGLDGFDLTKKLRAEGAKLPIIALTSLASEEDERRALEVGVDSFQVKLDRDEFLGALKGLLDRKEAEMAGQRDAAPKSEGEKA